MSFLLLGILNSQAAAGGAGAYDLLETQVLTSSASSVTFTGLDTLAADYQHLQIRMLTRNDYAGGGVGQLWVRFNNVSTSSYAHHRLEGNGSSVSAAATASTNQIYIFANPFGTQGTDNMFGATVMDVLDFSSASKNTTVRALYGGHYDSQARVGLAGGLYNATTAVTRIDIISDTATDFITGSRFSLYGIKGA